MQVNLNKCAFCVCDDVKLFQFDLRVAEFASCKYSFSLIVMCGHCIVFSRTVGFCK